MNSPATALAATPALHLGELAGTDRSAGELLARGYKLFYNTEVSDAGYALGLPPG